MLNFKKIIIKIFYKINKNGVFYISGPELLPPPLSNEEEIDAINKMPYDPSASSKLI
jgi:hypothetical protein